MRKSIIAGAALTASLALAGTAQADTVKSLDGPWSASNSTVQKVTGGVHFGTYANAGMNGGSVLWHGADGMKLSDVKDFSYTFNYKQAEYGPKVRIAAPYARIYLENNTQTVLLDPSFCDTVMPAEKNDVMYQMVNNSDVRYTDDACGATHQQQSWADVVADHGGEKISKIAVTQGYSGGNEVSAMLKNITFNGEMFDFTAAPADGSNGTNGANGKDGVTTIIRENAVPQPVQEKIGGATIRTLHVRKIAGMKFIGARASLRGKSVRTIRGRTIKVDLRGKSVGRYRVLISAKYKAHGKVYKVRSTRTLRILQK